MITLGNLLVYNSCRGPESIGITKVFSLFGAIHQPSFKVINLVESDAMNRSYGFVHNGRSKGAGCSFGFLIELMTR